MHYRDWKLGSDQDGAERGVSDRERWRRVGERQTQTKRSQGGARAMGERDKRRNIKSNRQTGTEAWTERGTGQSQKTQSGLSSEPEGSPIEGGCCLQSHQPRDPEVPHFRATGRDPTTRTWNPP